MPPLFLSFFLSFPPLLLLVEFILVGCGRGHASGSWLWTCLRVPLPALKCILLSYQFRISKTDPLVHGFERRHFSDEVDIPWHLAFLRSSPFFLGQNL